MKILDKYHFYKIDGDFLLLINELAIAAQNADIIQILLNSGKICEKMQTYNPDEIQ